MLQLQHACLFLSRDSRRSSITSMNGARAVVLLFAAAISSIALADDRFAQLDGMKIHYIDRGSGPHTVVLVHGWNCDATVWKWNIDGLAQHARVLAIDLPGHGGSEKPDIAYNMELHARAIDAVLREAKVDRATLVGHSNGTPVIRQFYRMFRPKTEALIVVDGALRPFAEGAEMEKFLAPMRGPGYREYVEKLSNFMLRPMKDESRRNEIQNMMSQGPQNVAVSEMESLLNPQLWTNDKIDVPTMVLLAKQPAWTADYEKFVRELVLHLDYRVWEGVSHFLMVDRPDDFNAAVLEFFGQNVR